jgi:hypothetical protein
MGGVNCDATAARTNRLPDRGRSHRWFHRRLPVLTTDQPNDPE